MGDAFAEVGCLARARPRDLLQQRLGEHAAKQLEVIHELGRGARSGELGGSGFAQTPERVVGADRLDQLSAQLRRATGESLEGQGRELLERA